MYTLLQTQDQNEKIYNALGRGGGVFNKCIIAETYFHYSETSRSSSEFLVSIELLLANTCYNIS